MDPAASTATTNVAIDRTTVTSYGKPIQIAGQKEGPGQGGERGRESLHRLRRRRRRQAGKKFENDLFDLAAQNAAREQMSEID
jgi:hypothetical protein